MRILLVTHQAPPHIGGVEQAVLTEAEGLLQAGHEVVWVTSNGRGSGQQVPTHSRLRLVKVGALHLLESWFGIAYPLFGPRLLPVLWREVKAADVVHAHGLVFGGSIVASVLSLLRRRPCVVTDHGGLLHYRFWPATAALWLLLGTFGRLTARCATRLIAINGDLQRLLVRLCGRADKVVFAGNAVDPSRFRPPQAEERRAARARLGWDATPRVLLAGRLLPHKGIDVLLAAADPSYRLVFCGPGDAGVIARIEGAGAQYLAGRPQAELLQVYHAVDAVALPSRNEGFPLVVLEALACGLPVLTSDAPAYAPYRGLPQLGFCAPEPQVVRARLLELLGRDRSDAVASPPLLPDRSGWLLQIFGDLAC
jgi:glycosyltransferase involved in cell wall biosynthesis